MQNNDVYIMCSPYESTDELVKLLNRELNVEYNIFERETNVCKDFLIYDKNTRILGRHTSVDFGSITITTVDYIDNAIYSNNDLYFFEVTLVRDYPNFQIDHYHDSEDYSEEMQVSAVKLGQIYCVADITTIQKFKLKICIQLISLISDLGFTNSLDTFKWIHSIGKMADAFIDEIMCLSNSIEVLEWIKDNFELDCKNKKPILNAFNKCNLDKIKWLVSNGYLIPTNIDLTECSRAGRVDIFEYLKEIEYDLKTNTHVISDNLMSINWILHNRDLFERLDIDASIIHELFSKNTDNKQKISVDLINTLKQNGLQYTDNAIINIIDFAIEVDCVDALYMLKINQEIQNFDLIVKNHITRLISTAFKSDSGDSLKWLHSNNYIDEIENPKRLLEIAERHSCTKSLDWLYKYHNNIFVFQNRMCLAVSNKPKIIEWYNLKYFRDDEYGLKYKRNSKKSIITSLFGWMK